MATAGKGNTFWNRLLQLPADSGLSLQAQLRQQIVSAILSRQLPEGSALPSSRELAATLGIARNTVILAFQQLVDEHFLETRPRRGYFVVEQLPSVARPPSVGNAGTAGTPASTDGGSESPGPDWSERLPDISGLRAIVKPNDWQNYPYPFIYGQFDPALFPTADWRECSRMALAVLEIRGWASDLIDRDDPLLIEQLQRHVLPRRGVWANPDEIMVTLGAQHALYLLADLLMRDAVVGLEEPGYSDARAIFGMRAREVVPLPVDDYGLRPEGELARCDYAFVTPSYQCPTTVTMPLDRREALLAEAHRHDVVLIEDDYDTENPALTQPIPALKSLDREGRVIYVGSLSKSFVPGIRLGYIVAPSTVIRQARALRRYMLRHPPANNQRATALFISLGHHDALLRRVAPIFQRRAAVLRDMLARHLPQCRVQNSPGASSLWVEGPPGLDARKLGDVALRHGVIIEPGDVFFAADGPSPHFRLGYTGIAEERIEEGVRLLAQLIEHERRR
ncbi:PLP-dependent aminotransferase family protein [Cupriavidus sp. DB3]|uniref:MocR-like pyridoxine biosynthesis transcription factor PdxR n=1 Tax=Cupriavidus sp. DB3 TaxID=2873259 RepID=UPI001CF24CE3|nr:PLP-dependent aminotransferase family protein [Cupriavidus sp. DB3]MCA7082985.1 PLP-dependent aminotransferase family protein [Cupriavidus sp. DB3]